MEEKNVPQYILNNQTRLQYYFSVLQKKRLNYEKLVNMNK